MERTIKIQQYKCEECGEICDSKGDLNLHRSQCHRVSSTNQHNPPNQNLIGCLRCSLRFPTYRLRFHHMFVHRNISPLMCRYCNTCFNTVHKADHHSRSAHIRNGTTPMFVCRNCFMCFHQVKSYERHLYVHKNRFKCTDCFRRFHHLNQFHDHWTATHSNVRKKIPKESDSISIKSDDISECSSVKSEFSLSFKEDESEGMDSTSDGMLQCKCCRDSFPCKESLLLHMERGLKRFNCRHCRWIYFSSQRKLDRHTKKCHPPNVGEEEKSNKQGMDKENIENATKISTRTLEPRCDLVVDEVGDVDMSGFEDLIKQFLS